MSVTYPVIRMTIGGEQVLEFSGEQIISATLIEEINLISVELPISTIEFKIISYDESFSMFSGEYFQLLSERLPLLVYESVEGSSRFLGKFYLEDWGNLSDYEFEFKAIDLIGVLETMDYDGGFWETPITVEAILAELLDPIDVLYTLDASIKDNEIKGWIPPGKYRTVLQQICFAAGATVSTARSDRLNILPSVIPSGLFDYQIEDSDKSVQQPIKLLPLVAGIELISHNYTQGLVLENIFEEYLEAGIHKIVFDKPYYSLIIDGPGYTPSLLLTQGGDFLITEGGDFIEVGGAYVIGSNYLILNMLEAGTITVTGYPWLDGKYSFSFTELGITEFANKKELKITDATMVSIVNGQAVLDKLIAYYRLRYLQTNTLMPSLIKTGDIVRTGTIFEKDIVASVQKMNIDMTGGYLAIMEALGISPVYILPVENYAQIPRTHVALCGTDLMRQNSYRRY